MCRRCGEQVHPLYMSKCTWAQVSWESCFVVAVLLSVAMCPKVWVGNILQCNSVQKWGLLGSVEAQKTNLKAGQPLAEDLGSFPSNNKADHNCPYLPFWGIKHPVMAVCMRCINVDAGKTPMHIILKQNGSRKSVNRYFWGPFVNRWK